MLFSLDEVKRLLPRVVLSLSVSALIIAALIHFTLSSVEQTMWSGLVGVASGFSLSYVWLYLAASVVRTVLQAWRYRVLINTSEKTAPSLFHMLLVTMSRNMCVDMLPARLGELSYIGMLNRGYRVSGQACISSLVISFVFDLIALGCLIMGLVVAQALGGDFQTWMLGVFIMLTLLIVFLLTLLYPALSLTNRLISRVPRLHKGVFSGITTLLLKIEEALLATRRAGISTRILLISLGIRVSKYLGLYCLFVGVVVAQFPDMTTRIAMVLPALIGAEAGAALPVPAFMGFGTYEAGGTLALVALGAGTQTSLIVMLAMHVISQIIDYLLGAIGLILFIFKAEVKRTIPVVAEVGGRGLWKRMTVLGIISICAALFLLYEVRMMEKRGSIRPPDRGKAVAPAPISGEQMLTRLHGFLVWSSNRSGNHDIYLYSLPDRTVRRLTTNPHTEYYPRISPDGTQVVFARSRQPWVSQRNIYPWDVWTLDIASGEERLVAENGTTPTWSADGTQVHFLRNGTEVVATDLRSKRETVLYKSGVSVKVPPKTILETPDISGSGLLAVTLRGAMRATARVDRDGTVVKVGNGCQLNWGPDDSYLYTIGHGGKMQNVLYRIDGKTLEAKKWFDSPGPYSHEYFPRVANTNDVLVYGASRGGHEHDSADYEIFIWAISQRPEQAVRITHHTGNDCWPDIFLRKPLR